MKRRKKKKKKRRRIKTRGPFKKRKQPPNVDRRPVYRSHKSGQTEGGSIKGYSVRVTKHCLLVVTHQEGRKGSIEYEVNQRRVKGTPKGNSKGSCKTQDKDKRREKTLDD